LDPEDGLIDSSLLTKFRKTRITEDILEEMLKETIRQAIDKGLIRSTAIMVDATHVRANAAAKRPTRLLREMTKKLRLEIYKSLYELSARFPESPQRQRTCQKKSTIPEGCLRRWMKAYWKAAVQAEKEQPYELILSAQGNTGITDSTIADILKIPDVKAVTLILQVPVAIRTGKYDAQLTLIGMDTGYLDGVYTQRAVFPADSVMPYILLNEAAQKQFTEDKPDTDQKNVTTETYTSEDRPVNANAKTPEIDWLNASYSLISGEAGRSVTSKVCGILSDGDAKDAEPAAYVSLPVAKGLLRESKQSTGRCKNRMGSHHRCRLRGCRVKTDSGARP
jgi:hypothetical protein